MEPLGDKVVNKTLLSEWLEDVVTWLTSNSGEFVIFKDSFDNVLLEVEVVVVVVVVVVMVVLGVVLAGDMDVVVVVIVVVVVDVIVDDVVKSIFSEVWYCPLKPGLEMFQHGKLLFEKNIIKDNNEKYAGNSAAKFQRYILAENLSLGVWSSDNSPAWE